jgi:hypothetical protein
VNFWEAHLGIGKMPEPGEIWTFDHEEGPWPKENAIFVKIRDVKDGWVRYEHGYRRDERMKIRAFRWCYNFVRRAE